MRICGCDAESEYYRLRRDQPEDWDQSVTIIVKTDLAESKVDPWIRAQIAALNPTFPIDIRTLSKSVAELADQPRFETLLVSIFAAIGLTLAAVVLYGVITYLVEQRTQEIGVRMALGASRSDVLLLIIITGLRVLIPGLLLGCLISMLLAGMLSRVLFQVSPRDPAALVGAAVILAVTATAAMIFPSFAAMKVEPSVVLRRE